MISGEPIQQYHSSGAVSHSSLEVFRERPLLYKKRFIDKTIPRVESPAFAIGSALHCLTLEGFDKFAATFAVKPDDIDRRAKDGKARWEAFCAENQGKTVIDKDGAGLVNEMAAAIQAHPVAAELLAGGKPELTWRKPSKALGRDLQCRTDWFNAEGCALTNGRPYLVDIKTTDALGSFREFQRSFVNYGYHRQAGFYIPLLQDHGISVQDFYFVAVEKSEPFGVVVYQPTPDCIMRGVDETVGDLMKLAECYRTNVWPNLPTDVQEMKLPEWYN